MAAPAPTPDARPASASEPSDNRSARSAHPKARLNRNASDDEILGLDAHASSRGTASISVASASSPQKNPRDAADAQDSATRGTAAASTPLHADAATHAAAVAEPQHLRAALDANPELRTAWQDANAYRETFATPDEARAATASLADLDRMDALFFSRRPEDHAELARAVAKLDPAAFASLSHAMTQLAQTASHDANSVGAQPAGPSQESRNVRDRESATGFASTSSDNRAAPNGSSSPTAVAGRGTAAPLPNQLRPADARHESRITNHESRVAPGPTHEQTQFFHATNAATVEGVLAAIETQVERLLPEGVSKTARNRVVGEIYRELDTTLRSNRALAQQMRDAFRSGALDGDHQNAIVSLVTGRARQALPAVAKRVLNEWTSTVVSANQQRRERQRTAERRVDIAGSGGAANDDRRSLGPRDIDYARLSDADILNL